MAQNRRGSGRSGNSSRSDTGRFRTPEIRGTLGTLIRSALAQAGGVREVLERGVREGRERFDNYRSDARRNEALAELGEIVLDLVRRGEIDPNELPEARDVIRHLEELDGEDGDAGVRDRDEIAQPPSRSRFDTRSSSREDDGTTSSSRWSPPKPAKPAARVWRPVDPAPEEAAPAPAARRVPLPKDPHRKGGISFGDDDDDLADYMHPDDVPAKPSSDE
jgi:hypothetical protein